MSLSYEQIHKFFADNCPMCEGLRRLPYGVGWISCPCQEKATAKFRIEQIDVHPPQLKYKEWSDFTGLIKKNGKISGSLVPASALEAKLKAMEYCFGSKDTDAFKDRSANLVIHKRLSTGKNVVIVGDRNSGKTLLATLMLKEVVYASFHFKVRLTFKWIKSSSLSHAAKWDNNRTVDHSFIDHLEDIHFLAIDGIDLPKGGHNIPPDMDTLDVLFHHRKMYGYPTIFICSPEFWNAASDERYQGAVIKKWGEEFFGILTDPNNTVIHLLKEGSRK